MRSSKGKAVGGDDGVGIWGAEKEERTEEKRRETKERKKRKRGEERKKERNEKRSSLLHKTAKSDISMKRETVEKKKGCHPFVCLSLFFCCFSF